MSVTVLPVSRQPTVIIKDMSEEERERMDQERQAMEAEREAMKAEREEFDKERDKLLEERKRFQEERVMLQGDLNTAHKVGPDVGTEGMVVGKDGGPCCRGTSTLNTRQELVQDEGSREVGRKE